MMKFSWITCSLLSLLVCVAACSAQESRVHIAYDPTMRSTRLLSPHCLLMNTPDQFLDAQFVAFWPGESTQGAPAKINITFTSLAPRLIYYGRENSLFIGTEFEKLNVGPIRFYGAYRQISSDLPDIYEFTRSAVIRVPTPHTALVRVVNPNVLLTVESFFSRNITLAQMSEIVGSRNLTVTLDNSTIELASDCVQKIRAFAQGVPDADKLAPEPSTFVAEPAGSLDATSASLELVLNWLKKEMTFAGRIKDVSGDWVTTELEKTSDCSMTVRERPIIWETIEDSAILRPSIQYVVNLGDLNPRSAYVTFSSKYSTVRVATTDNKRTIAVSVLQAETEKQLEQRMDYNLAINLQDSTSAFEVRKALTRAIILCSASR
jgi:hypothetical protein